MTDAALNLAQVLWDERTALSGQDLHSPHARIKLASNEKKYSDLAEPDLNAIFKELNKDDRWALCLSGGGIRSAALALGIVQFFASQRVVPKAINQSSTPVPLLKQFDYLSTVSGGGYLGSWLSAWLFQTRKEKRSTDTVLTALAERAGDHREADPIVNLRRDSHYLAPSFSAISPDVWADIATIARNLALVWLLLIPPLVLAVLISKAFAYGFVAAVASTVSNGWLMTIVIFASALCLLISLAFTAANRPTRGLSNGTQVQFVKYELLGSLIGGVLLVFLMAIAHWAKTPPSGLAQSLTSLAPFSHPLALGGLLGLGLYAISWVAAYLWLFVPGSDRQVPTPTDAHQPVSRVSDNLLHRIGQWSSDYWPQLAEFGAWCLAGVAFGMLVAAGHMLLQYLAAPSSSFFYESPRWQLLALVTGGVPWILGARMIADVVFVAPATFLPRSDGDLEYQARAGGLYTLAQLGWLIWFGLILFATPLVSTFHWWLASVGGVAGAVSVILGSSSKTPAFIRDTVEARKYLTLNRVAGIAAAIFGAVLIIAVGVAVDWTLFRTVGPDYKLNWLMVLWTGVTLVAMVLLIPLVININRFSLHGLYRNRLVRTFLGASRPDRARDKTKNNFTDFDTKDTPCLHELWDHATAPSYDDWRPLHIINTTLNLVSSTNLAWQERKAAPFTFSPLHAGTGSSAFGAGAFRRTYRVDKEKAYGAGTGGSGLTLGTAMAISGAAVSPNMGYNSSPGVGFLMTLFNVRLGWWLPNPRSGNAAYWYNGPGWALKPLVMEMFGLTSELHRWIYLSDGAHFENFGLYEMVRRRCRVIVVSDGGEDPDYEFQDLGNALRKIWIDLGVRIDFVGLDQLKKRFKDRPTPAANAPYWAVGRILYTEADGPTSPSNPIQDGWLLYFKAGVHGTEPMDVLSYAMKHPNFPHETTANQFFSESQLEAYRALGYEMARNALCYAERERQHATATGPQPAAIATQPLGKFSCSPSTMNLRDIIEKLEAQLLRTA
jgi:hypothetical protein